MALFFSHVGGATFAPDVDKHAATVVLAWIVSGFNEAFLPTAKDMDEPADLLRRYETELRGYLSIITPCLCAATRTADAGGPT
jgi:hypothetical protein